MDVAIEEYDKQEHDDAYCHLPVVEEQRARHKKHQPSQVEHQEDDHQIKHDEDRRGAYLIHHLRHRQ